MAAEELSAEIVNRGEEGSGPYAGSPSFSVRVRRRMPDFLNSVNLKYVKLGYRYLINHGWWFYLIVTVPGLLALILGAAGLMIEKLQLRGGDPPPAHDVADFAFVSVFLAVIVYLYFDLSPRSTYLVDFACYRPPKELKITKEEFIELAKKSSNFDAAAIEFQRRVLENSGIGDQSYMPRSVFAPVEEITLPARRPGAMPLVMFGSADNTARPLLRTGKTSNLREGRAEAAQVMFGAVDDLIAATKVRPGDIGVLVVNCGVLNTTPSLSAMLINHYKLRHDIHSFNLGGMGCAAGVVAVDLAKDLLAAHPRASYALVVSTEVVSSTWYAGKEIDMLAPNCFFRMGAAAVLLSNRRLDRWRAKYELKQVVRTYKGTDERSFKSVYLREDVEGKQGLSVRRDLLEVGGHALKANITTLGPLVLPVSEQILFFKHLLFGRKKKPKSSVASSSSSSSSSSSTPYIPDYKLAFEHVCILASSRAVLDELQRHLGLTEEYMEASRRTLERFGNTSSSSVWYELAYLEARGRVTGGDRVWQLAFGSGLKCNSMVWKALRTVGRPTRSPWIEEEADDDDENTTTIRDGRRVK